jgi:hypothetical protein
MTDSSTDRDDRIGRALVSLLAAGFVIVIGILLVAGETRPSAYYIPLGGLLLAIGFALILRGSRRANAALLLLLLAPLPWLANAALVWLARVQSVREQQVRREYAEHAGIAFDSRSPMQVVLDLRKQGRDAWPAVHPALVQRTTPAGSESVLRGADGKELQPLGGIANVDTEYGNEEGRYLIYRSDEHGFHNPPGIWALPSIDVAAVGDSMTHGASVPSSSNLVAVIRRRWPSTLNLGYGGNGPLIELASLLEYLPQRRPRVVLWVLVESNDLGEDLTRELRSPLLRRYWKEKRNLQNLENSQSEIDTRLRDYVEKELARLNQPAPKPNPVKTLIGLDEIREMAWNIAHASPYLWNTFSEVLQAARDTVRSWHGELYLVYLPMHYLLRENWLSQRVAKRGEPEQRRQHALEIGRTLGISVIDLEPVLQQAGPQLDTFRYPYRGHFTAAGYEALGRAIVKRLEADGL